MTSSDWDHKGCYGCGGSKQSVGGIPGVIAMPMPCYTTKAQSDKFRAGDLLETPAQRWKKFKAQREAAAKTVHP